MGIQKGYFELIKMHSGESNWACCTKILDSAPSNGILLKLWSLPFLGALSILWTTSILSQRLNYWRSGDKSPPLSSKYILTSGNFYSEATLHLIV